MDYKVTKKYWIENYFCTRADIFNCCLCLDILKCVEYNYLGSQCWKCFIIPWFVWKEEQSNKKKQKKERKSNTAPH